MAASANPEEKRLLDRLYWRLVPLFFLMMLCNYLFRVNVGFAALRMNQDLGFSASICGFGASVFFAGYVVLQIGPYLIGAARMPREASRSPL